MWCPPPSAMSACGFFTGRGVIIACGFMFPRGLVYLTLNFVEQGVAADLKHFGVEFLCSAWELGGRRYRNPGEPTTLSFAGYEELETDFCIVHQKVDCSFLGPSATRSWFACRAAAFRPAFEVRPRLHSAYNTNNKLCALRARSSSNVSTQQHG